MQDIPSILDINIDEAQEMRTLPDGAEVLLRIDRAEITPNKNDPTRFNLALVFVDPGDPATAEIKMWLPIATPEFRDADPRGYNRLLLRWKAFYEAAGIPSGRLDVSSLPGTELYAIVGEEEDPTYGKQNFIRRFSPRR